MTVLSKSSTEYLGADMGDDSKPEGFPWVLSKDSRDLEWVGISVGKADR